MKNIIYCFFGLTLIFLASCSKDLEGDRVQHLDSTTEDQLAFDRRSCESKEKHNALMQDPSYQAEFKERMEKARSQVSYRSTEDCKDPIILPVAIHFQRISNPDQQCLEELVQRQIDVLNNDFNALNEDATLWSQVAQNYPGVDPSSTCVKFCLADKNHPGASGLQDGQAAITFSNSQNDEDADWSGYINVFVRDIDYLGSSPLGGYGNGDGVLISETAFGIGQGCGQVTPEAPFDLGRTLTHELGHFLSMDHVWGDGGCNSDDGISDTPNQSDDSAGCPSINKSTCGSVDMHMNYMDYANDACMYMFSNEQAAKMNSYIRANLQNVINKGEEVCSNMDNDNNNDDEPSNDDELDSDGDGILDNVDNCPNTPNANQADADNDGIGSVCDTDEGFDEGCKNIRLVFEADDYPEDIKWWLKNTDTGKLVEKGGPYEWDPNNSTFVEDFCLEDGCYKLIVRDLYQDGLCCYYGDGYFYLEEANGETIYESDGKYGRKEVTYFCVSNNQVSNLKIETDKRATDILVRERKVLSK